MAPYNGLQYQKSVRAASPIPRHERPPASSPRCRLTSAGALFIARTCLTRPASRGRADEVPGRLRRGRQEGEGGHRRLHDRQRRRPEGTSTSARPQSDGEGIYSDKGGKVLVDSRFRKAFELAMARRRHRRQIGAWSNEWGRGLQGGKIATQMMGAWLGGHLASWLAPDTKGQWRWRSCRQARSPPGAAPSMPSRRRRRTRRWAWEFVKYMTLDRDQQLRAARSMPSRHWCPRRRIPSSTNRSPSSATRRRASCGRCRPRASSHRGAPAGPSRAGDRQRRAGERCSRAKRTSARPLPTPRRRSKRVRR